jgi:hypothetical protein
VIQLHAPIAELGAGFRRQHCGFSYRGVVTGHVDRSDVASLSEVLAGLHLEIGDVVAAVAPANPEAPLTIYADPGGQEVAATVTRGDVSPVFVLKGADAENSDYMQVKYVPAGRTANEAEVVTGYIDRTSDRDQSLDGTFRKYYLEQTSQQPRQPLDQPDWVQNLNAFARRLVKAGAESVAIMTGKEELAKLAGCMRSGSLTLSVKANGGFTNGFLGASVESDGKLIWTIGPDDLFQFANIGVDGTLLLAISGLAKCKDRSPFYLQDAAILIDSPGSQGQPVSFSIVRDEFYRLVERNEKLKPYKLEDESKIANTNGTLNPLLVLPKVDGDSSPLYWAAFDTVEQFMTEHVFDVKAVPDRDKLAVILLTMQALSLWRSH